MFSDDIFHSIMSFLNAKDTHNISLTDKYATNTINNHYSILKIAMDDKDYKMISKYIISRSASQVQSISSNDINEYIKNNKILIHYLIIDAIKTTDIDVLYKIMNRFKSINQQIYRTAIKCIENMNSAVYNLIYSMSDEYISQYFILVNSISIFTFNCVFNDYVSYIIMNKNGYNPRKYRLSSLNRIINILNNNVLINQINQNFNEQHLSNIVDIFAHVARYKDYKSFKILTSCDLFLKMISIIGRNGLINVFFSKMLIALSHYNKWAIDHIINNIFYEPCLETLYEYFDEDTITNAHPHIVKLYMFYESTLE